jgi:hypothetical protein
MQPAEERGGEGGEDLRPEQIEHRRVPQRRRGSARQAAGHHAIFE